jgi:hypothetical protein
MSPQSPIHMIDNTIQIIIERKNPKHFCLKLKLSSLGIGYKKASTPRDAFKPERLFRKGNKKLIKLIYDIPISLKSTRQPFHKMMLFSNI